IHGDTNGPGFKEEVVEAGQRHRGRRQVAHPGSCAVIEGHIAVPAAGFTIAMWIFPTTPEKGTAQGLFACRNGDNGLALVIGEGGDLGLWVGSARHYSGSRLRARQWYLVAASFDAASRRAVLYQLPFPASGYDEPIVAARPALGLGNGIVSASLTTIAATHLETMADGRRSPRGCYNGKIERPALFGRALSGDEVERLSGGALPEEVAGGDLVAAWDLSVGIATRTIKDTGRNRTDGLLVNKPLRAVTGHNWTGEKFDFRDAAAEYGAIHFHD